MMLSELAAKIQNAGDLDAARMIIELRVAPSQPLAFLTVRLVQTGTGTLQVLTS